MEISADVKDAYETVRRSDSSIRWATFVYSGNVLVLDQTGSDHEAFLARLPQDAPVFAYYRAEVPVADATRTRFAFITWVGSNTSPLKKGKIPVDKPAIKQIIKDFSADITTSDPAELAYERIQDKLSAASY
ncbi:coactosin family protein [Streptomyces cinereoruber]|uniref:coactosin family protein n=1 Tax=Streptomyces cinereoruber TaxID=67260 RepID=UPI003C2D5A81